MLRTVVYLIAFTFGSLLIASPVFAADANAPIPGIGPAGEIKKLHTNFQFTEGPATDPTGNLYFTDVAANRIHNIDVTGQLSTFMQDTQGINGLSFDGSGQLLACQGSAKRLITIDPVTQQISVLADQYQNKPFNQPNDLVVDGTGGVYFTDPLFGKGEMHQGKTCVFYVAPNGDVASLIDDLVLPNGIMLSPDEKTLYVLPSGTGELMAYGIESPGKLGAGRKFCALQQSDKGQKLAGGDGMTVDTQGNLYLTLLGKSAIQVVDPQGTTLGLIDIPEPPSNCTFGGPDMKTLYVTARSSVYAVPMLTTGHRFRGTVKK